MLREGQPVGTIAVTGASPQAFSAQHEELLKTFSDQAVIAIENVQLFKELEARNRDLTESLDQQTATSEILRVISSSPTNLQPVLDVVAENAARVCGANDALIRLVEGAALRLVAKYGPLQGDESILLDRGSAVGRAISDRRTIHVHDMAAESETEFPTGKENMDRFGYRTVLATPLLREGVPIGGIAIRRAAMQPF